MVSFLDVVDTITRARRLARQATNGLDNLRITSEERRDLIELGNGLRAEAGMFVDTLDGRVTDEALAEFLRGDV